ncbi:MAG: hypothetical protein PW843_11435 [Azospirillaceae bacterium]|nr:hypothetical protein [Azospirillaceae bacterium]
MGKKTTSVLAAVAGCAMLAGTARAADSLFTWNDIYNLKIYHAYAASDGKSYVEEINVPAMRTKTLSGSSQTYFDLKPVEMRIARGVSGEMMDWHGAVEYRHLLIPLQGSLQFEMDDGRFLELKPGEAILAEDWTGHGHRSGCAASKNPTCVVIDIMVEPNPHSLPLRDPPKH